MKTLAKCLILLNLLLPVQAFGAGIYRVDNLVVGASGASPYHTGASVYVRAGGNSTGVTAYAIVNSDGKTLTKTDGTGTPFIWFTSSVSLWMVGNELYTNKSDGTTVHLNP